MGLMSRGKRFEFARRLSICADLQEDYEVERMPQPLCWGQFTATVPQPVYPRAFSKAAAVRFPMLGRKCE
jgi:hypothetical protein